MNEAAKQFKTRPKKLISNRNWQTKYPLKVLNSRLKYEFGITLEQYNKMFEAQNGKCAICKQPETRIRNGKVTKLEVDHNHITGKVRGLLCNSCNSAIGKLKADEGISILLKAIDYINKTKI